MLPTDLGVLEFDKFKAVLEAYAVSSSGKARIQALQPSDDFKWVERELRACDEAMVIQTEHQGIPLQGLHNVSSLLERLRKGGVLDAKSLLDIAAHLRVVRRVKTYLIKIQVAERFPQIVALTAALRPFPAFETRIEQTISPDGEVLESASSALRRIRVSLHQTRQRLHEKLQSILTSSQYEGAIQERVITLRNGRYVIPVKQDGRGVVRGVVQGQSSSGMTVFMEPLVVVEMNNALHTLTYEEEEEIKRILAELSDELAAEADALTTNADILTELDFLRAKAQFASDYRCVSPRLTPKAAVELREARHPLLEHHFRQERRQNPDAPQKAVVPLTVTLGGDTLGLVITGPNTGGKTVGLKTVGLLALMTQCGIPIPVAPGSAMGVFNAICADIGDEQSIEQSLSTFSSHMSRILRILNQSTARTLVLLDEVGAGTDPTEGAALAMSLLDAFTERGSLLMVTTHYGALKSYAHSHPKLLNASMEFDAATLSPTYRLIVGLPGSSHALRVAERLGLPPRVLENARARLGDKTVAIEDLISDVERLRRELETEQKSVRETLARADAKEQEHKRLLTELKTKRQELRAQAEADAEKVLRDARALIERTVAELRHTNASRESILESHRALEQAVAQIRNAGDTRERGKQDKADASTEKREKKSVFLDSEAFPFEVGDSVYVKTMRAVGEVADLPDGRGGIRVKVGAMTVNVPLSELEVPSKDAAETPYAKKYHALQSEKKATISATLNLMGMRVVEAIEEVDKYLDDAALAGLSRVTLLHGKGTGALRTAIHQHLRKHPVAESFRSGTLEEGDAGVTIVTIGE